MNLLSENDVSAETAVVEGHINDLIQNHVRCTGYDSTWTIPPDSAFPPQSVIRARANWAASRIKVSTIAIFLLNCGNTNTKLIKNYLTAENVVLFSIKLIFLYISRFIKLLWI